MKFPQRLDRRAANILGSITILLGAIAPAAIPAFVSAAVPQNRSIQMSSSATGATGVSYELKYKAATGIAASGGLVIDFCNDSPLIGLTCDTATNPPDASAATLGAVKYDGSAASGAGSITKTATNIKWTAGAAYTAGQDIDITFNNITNPADADTFFARITTYTNSTNLATYSAPNNVGTAADRGGIALATTEKIGVTAYVAETMRFCVSKAKPTAGCGSVTDPSWTLGEETSTGSGVFVLSSGAVSTGKDWAQLSTNAAHGVIVNLHSNAVGCGGLIRQNDGTNCDITAQNATSASNTIGNGQAKFGLTVGPDEDATTDFSSFGGLTKGSLYSATNYFIDYVTGDATGVTSTYGSKLFDSDDGGGTPGPVANRNMPFTFGVSAAPTTPAGIYTADLNLIATGTF